MPGQSDAVNKGGTLRLGAWPCEIRPGTRLMECYGAERISERHRHRYEVNNDYRAALEQAGLVLCGQSPDGQLVEAVELGAHAVVPVETKNTVVKLDDKRAQKKVERWQAIAEAAAKQSKRSIVLEVKPVMSWREALQFTEDFDLKLIPYENAHDMKKTLSELQNVPKHGKIAVFIGPEGGFDEAEIVDAEAHEFVPISLGKRILRTETAAIASMSVLMMTLELQSAEG